MLTFLAIAERYKPKWIVWENVPGVLSSNGGKDFGSFLGALGELGYGWAYRVLDAQWFGVAQRRRRVFVVGCLGDQRAAAEVLFESESVSRNPAPSREKRQAAAGSTEESVGSSGEWTSPNGKEIVGAMRARDYKGIGNDDLTEGRGLVISKTQQEEGQWWDGGQTASTITTRSGGQYMPDKDNFQAVIQPTIIDRAAFNQGENAQYEPKIEESETMSSLVARGPHAIAHAYRKSKRAQSTEDDETWVDDGVSNTLNNFDVGDTRTTHAVVAVDTFNQTTNEHTSQTLGSSATDVNHYGAVINPPMAIRRLTPVECERLQGFPDNWTRIPWKKKPAEECPDGPRYKACGNSMAVPCMKWLGQRIQKAQDKIEDGKNN